MTTRTLYVPVLIETTEQAEALPVGTVAYLPGTGGWVDTAAKVGPSRWCGGDDDPGTRDLSMVGWTALVPVEAEEEHAIWRSWEGSANGLGIPVPPGYPFPDLKPGEVVHTRLVTHWTEVDA